MLRLHAMPRIRANVDAGVNEATSELHFIFVNSRIDVAVAADPETVSLVERIDGSRTVSELVESVGHDVDRESVIELLEFLDAERILEWSDEPSASVSARFSRQVAFFEDFTDDTVAAQDRIGAARVGIVGAGAIGSAIACQVARMGVRTIDVIDSDRVEESNLSRSPLYLVEDLEAPKAVALHRALERVSASYSAGRSFFDPLMDEHHEGLRWMSEECDVVVNCADEPSVAQTSEWVGKACMAAGTPHVLAGGYRTHLGFIGPTVIPGASACWRCFSDDYSRNDAFGRHGWRRLPSCRVSGGSLMALAETVASVHAWEVIRILSQTLPPLMTDRKAEINFLDLSISWHEVRSSQSCGECARVERAG